MAQHDNAGLDYLQVEQQQRLATENAAESALADPAPARRERSSSDSAEKVKSVNPVSAGMNSVLYFVIVMARCVCVRERVSERKKGEQEHIPGARMKERFLCFWSDQHDIGQDTSDRVTERRGGGGGVLVLVNAHRVFSLVLVLPTGKKKKKILFTTFPTRTTVNHIEQMRVFRSQE